MSNRKKFEPILNNECPTCGSLIVYETVPFRNGDEHIRAVCTKCSFDKFIPDYKENKMVREDNRLIKWAQIVKKRDNGVCKLCGTSENVEAHHIVPINVCKKMPHSKGVEYALNLNNGITLCKECHDLAHGKLV